MANFNSPKVLFDEIDNSVFALKSGDYFGAFVVRAKRGDTDPVFLSSLSRYKKLFTGNGKFEMDTREHLDVAAFLEREGSQCWILRVTPSDALYGGLVILDSGAAGNGAAIGVGLSTPGAYTFNADECLLITGANPGAWNDNLKVGVTNDTVNKTMVINVYETKNGADLLVESREVSLTSNATDGFGRNIYVETVFAGSDYIRVVHNTLSVAENTKDELTAISMANGADGSAVNDSDISTAWDTFNDTDKYKFRWMLQAGLGGNTVATKMITIAEARKDCVAILDSLEADVTTTALSTYRNTTLAADSTYASLYAPWITVKDYDNDVNAPIAPSGVVGGLLSEIYASSAKYRSPAGIPEGIIQAIDLVKRFDEADQDLLTPVQVNLFRFFPGRFVLWDDRTLQVQNSALSSIVTRLMMIDLRVTLKEIAFSFLHKPLTEATKNRLVDAMDDFLRTVKVAEGITQYKLVSDTLRDPSGNNPPANIDQGILTVDILIVPVGSIRGIQINATLTRAGAVIEEVGSVPI